MVVISAAVAYSRALARFAGGHDVLVDLVRITTRDGFQLDGMLQRPAASGSLALDAICLVHGTGGNFYSSSLFDHFSQKLLDRGCAVLRINTRGHDGISTAIGPRGGVRLGAAYETVDDCRHDLTACVVWLRTQVGPRVGLLVHSLGAVKCLYAVAHEPQLAPACIVAVSPPRLSYSWFCAGDPAAEFLATYQEAERLVAAGRPGALLEVKLPLPFVIAAAGYVEKYGPDERYNFLNFLGGVTCPTLVTLGSVEVERNMAFRGSPDEIARLIERYPHVALKVIAGADHFYTGAREEAWTAIAGWLPPASRAP
jgi:dienelactone hydrolase